MAKTNDALKILQKMTSEDPEMEGLIEDIAALNVETDATSNQPPTVSPDTVVPTPVPERVRHPAIPCSSLDRKKH